jgi:hypothetical protein
MFVRPGLKEFLEAVGEFADVVLFTAGLAGYAAPMLAALDPASTRLPVRLFRPSTVTVGGTACVKDLAVLGRDLGRTVLVDNSPFSFLAQPYCGLPAAPFDGCGHDSHLLDTVLPLLRQLAAGGDVRPALAARFGMAAWLSARGGWALYEAPCGNLSVAAGGGVFALATGASPGPAPGPLGRAAGSGGGGGGGGASRRPWAEAFDLAPCSSGGGEVRIVWQAFRWL